MVAWQSPHFRLPCRLAPKTPASTPTLCPAASCRLLSPSQPRQSVSASATRGAATTRSAPRTSAIVEAIFISAPINYYPFMPYAFRPAPGIGAGEKGLRPFSPGFRHAAWTCPGTLLFLQCANVRDHVLDLCVGQLAVVTLHRAFAVFCRGKKLGIGGLEHRRGLKGENLHALGHGCGGQAIGAVAHGALALVEVCTGRLRKGGHRNERGQQDHGSRFDSMSHSIAPWPVARSFPGQVLVI